MTPMRLQDDTLVIDLKNMDSVINSVVTQSFLVNLFANENIYYDIYGMTNEAFTSYWQYINDSENETEKQYTTHDGVSVVVSYVKIVGLFITYKYENTNYRHAFGEEIIGELLNICPLHILYSEPIDDFKIVVK